MANGNHSPVAASAASAAGNSMSVKKQNTRDKEKMQREREREKIVLWRRPIQTLKYCTLECFALLQYYGIKWVNKAVISVF